MVCARWVLWKLTETNQKLRIGWALQFLTEFQVEGNILLERVVTGEELWIRFCILETKEHNKVWKEKAEEAPQKFKTVSSAGEVMLTVF